MLIELMTMRDVEAVSYTHLDVYKRQDVNFTQLNAVFNVTVTAIYILTSKID